MAVAAERVFEFPGDSFDEPSSSQRVAEMFRELDSTLRGYLRRRMRCREDAEDIAQEVYLRMTRHHDLGQVQCLKAFALQTALNLVRDRSRRSYTRSQRQSVPIEYVDIADGHDPERHASNDESLALVMQTLSRLPDNTCRALVMHRFEGLRYAEIAQRLGVSVSMVEKHISAALLVLRDLPDVPGNDCRPSAAR